MTIVGLDFSFVPEVSQDGGVLGQFGLEYIVVKGLLFHGLILINFRHAAEKLMWQKCRQRYSSKAFSFHRYLRFLHLKYAGSSFPEFS